EGSASSTLQRRRAERGMTKGERAPTAEPPHYLGHRERLRDRFRKGGADALGEYELLELILFRAMPRRDVKPLAKSLIARFGSFAGAPRASARNRRAGRRRDRRAEDYRGGGQTSRQIR